MNYFLNILGQPEEHDNWGRMISLVVFFLLYAIAALFRNRKSKDKEVRLPRPTVPPEGTRTRIPPYARPRDTAETPTAQTPPAQPRPQAQPLPQRRIPIPGIPQGQSRPQMPKPGAPRPGGLQPKPGQMTPPPLRKTPPLGHAPAASAPRPPRKIAPASTAASRAQGVQVPRTTAATTLMKPESASLIATKGREPPKTVLEIPAIHPVIELGEEGPEESPAQVLLGQIQQREELARAVLYAEIMGKPVGLRTELPGVSF